MGFWPLGGTRCSQSARSDTNGRREGLHVCAPLDAGLCARMGLVGTHGTLTLRSRGSFLYSALCSFDLTHRWLFTLQGLLSSSCCALQLVLNAFSFGCAGFNTVLGPYRPPLMALTLVIQGWQWQISRGRFDMRQRATIASVIALPLMLLPEILLAYSTCAARSTRSALPPGRKEGSNKEEETKREPSSDGSTRKYRVSLNIQGMGCVACLTAVQGALLKTGASVASIQDVDIDVSSGRGAFTLVTDGPVDDGIQDAARAAAARLTDIGFDSKVSSVTYLATDQGDPIESKSETLPSGKRGGCIELWGFITAGLAASSCCLLQLGINLLAALDVAHLGCAGFNKWLGPARPYLRAATAAWLGGLWLYALTRKSGAKRKRRLLIGTLLTCVLMFLPEMVRAAGGPSMWPAAATPAQPTLGTLELSVEGMGCEACEDAVRRVLNAQPGVVDVTKIDYKTGMASIRINDDAGYDEAVLAQQLEHEGYGLAGQPKVSTDQGVP